MFEIGDIVTLEGITFNVNVLKNNGNKFKVIDVKLGTFSGAKGTTFIVEGVVDGIVQIFSKVTLAKGSVKVIKVGSENKES